MNNSLHCTIRKDGDIFRQDRCSENQLNCEHSHVAHMCRLRASQKQVEPSLFNVLSDQIGYGYNFVFHVKNSCVSLWND